MNHTIQVASRRSGLSQHVIRIWERRYRALCPNRSGTNRRMYSDADIHRLILLRELLEHGHRIGCIAILETKELESIAQQDRKHAAEVPPVHAMKAEFETPPEYAAACMHAARAFDVDRFKCLLQTARCQFGQRAMLVQVVCPLVCDIGRCWQKGEMRQSHEHFATAILREFLIIPPPGCLPSPHAPEIVVSTPAGEMHEMGALLVAAFARDLGWQVMYLGPNLPAEDIAACAVARKARAVALSLVYPEATPDTIRQLLDVRRHLPAGVHLIVGGRAAASYAEKMEGVRIQWVDNLASLNEVLLSLQSPASLEARAMRG